MLKHGKNRPIGAALPFTIVQLGRFASALPFGYCGKQCLPF